MKLDKVYVQSYFKSLEIYMEGYSSPHRSDNILVYIKDKGIKFVARFESNTELIFTFGFLYTIRYKMATWELFVLSNIYLIDYIPNFDISTLKFSAEFKSNFKFPLSALHDY